MRRSPVDTTCDGIDDDCSGQADEDFASGSAACGVGACIRRGVVSCVAGVVHNTCTPLNPAASDASCNGVDDDCDGRPDEDFVASVCVPALARCLTGTSRCTAGLLSCDPAASCRHDHDRDGVDDALDLDDDNDGIPDTLEGDLDPDGDLLGNALDLDSDGDGIADLFEAGLVRFDADGDGVVNGALGDNGLLDALESARNSGVFTGRPLDTDGDGVRDGLDLDSDADGSFDVAESGALAGFDANADGVLDRGADDDLDGITSVADRDDQYGYPRVDPRGTDRDGDGIPRAYDVADDGPGAGDSDADGLLDDAECPRGWPCVNADALGHPDYMDDDSDQDGVQTRGDLDEDNDGLLDSVEDGFASADLDADAIANRLDADADGDGIYDADEAVLALVDVNRDGMVDGKVDPDGVPSLSKLAGVPRAALDSDRDGTPDAADGDSDADGVEDASEAGDARLETVARDTDADGLADFRDPDDDGDGISTRDERALERAFGGDVDRDGLPNYLDLDSDGDGALDRDEGVADGDHDGIPDVVEPSVHQAQSDSDQDGVADASECAGTPCPDRDGDGLTDPLDADDDGDGVLTLEEGGPLVDSDHDGVADYLDADDDGDGVPSRDEPGDLDHDGTPDRLQPPPSAELSGGALCSVGVGRAHGGVFALLLTIALATLVARRVRARPRAAARPVAGRASRV